MNLKKYRKAVKMTQKQVGKYLGVAESTYNLYESGKRKIDYEDLLKLSELYGVTVEQLVTDNDGFVEIRANEPTEPMSPEKIENKMLRFALWGTDSGDMTDEDIEAVLSYAEFLRQKKRSKL